MIQEEIENHVITDSRLCGGRPCIRGTRIEIAVILDALSEGLSMDEIIDHYPVLKKEDIQAAAAYAAELTRENIWKATVL